MKFLNTNYNGIKNMKYLETNLTQYVQVLLTKNYKILSRETKENLKKQRDIPCSWFGRLYIVKMSILPQCEL